MDRIITMNDVDLFARFPIYKASMDACKVKQDLLQFGQILLIYKYDNSLELYVLNILDYRSLSNN